MQVELVIKGLASNKEYKLIPTKDQLNLSLLEYLIMQNIPISYSCRGELVCEKCTVSHNVLACSLTLKEYINEYGTMITIDYL